MKKLGRAILFILGFLCVVLISIYTLQTNSEESDVEIDLGNLTEFYEEEVKIEEPVSIDDVPLEDNMDIYQYDDLDSVVYMYVTIRKGNSSDNTDHTWQEVNDSTKFFVVGSGNTTVDKAEAIFQVGDENGPLPGEFGYGEIIPNGTIQVRGNTSSLRSQKSYKIELFDSAGEWRGQSTIALNKHQGDITRIRNKLCFDLMKNLDGLTSLRTQFVVLYVKDETTNPPSDTFVSYGLYTQIEQPNRTFLRNHLLDQDAQLYKPNFFEFFRYEDQLRLADDPAYNKEYFETILEIKGNQDHSKLITMLTEVNDWSIPIEQTFEKYFDAENYFTWMAFNILIGNLDTDSQNFYLYSPQNSQKWYFLPWDYDGSLTRQERTLLRSVDLHYYQRGIANYWGVVLHRRVLTIDTYRQQLDKKINELMNYITPELIDEYISTYRSVTDQYVLQMPDLLYLNGTVDDYNMVFELLPTEMQLNYEYYLESLESPMPFFLGEPQIVDNKIIFNWDEAYDFDAQNITYQFVLSKNWDLTDIIYQQEITNFLEIEVDLLEPGQYFWRVIAVNEDGKTQYPFDYFRDIEGTYHYGMRYFYILSDGQTTTIASNE